MLRAMRFSGFFSLAMVMILFCPSRQSFPPAEAIRSSSHFRRLSATAQNPPFSLSATGKPLSFRQASAFHNAGECASVSRGSSFSACDPSLVHVAITLDVEYLRGSMAAVYSVLQHSLCPENVFFHFVVSETNLETLVRSTFPQLKFKVYYFDPEISNP